MRKLKVLDLFSGIGGLSLGLERTGGFETVAFCEIEQFPRKVLAKHWPDVPCFPDVTKLKGSDVGRVNVICGGYPCQPFSTAGKRQGKEDDRHLWPEFMRLVVELRPAWVIGENVAGHVSMGLDDVLSDLESEGYACRPFIIPACAKDAKHRRDRVWTIAYANDVLHSGKLVNGRHPGQARRGEGSDECEGQASQWKRVRTEFGTSCEVLANSKGKQCDERQYGERSEAVSEGGLRKQTGASRKVMAHAERIGQQRQGACGNASDKAEAGEGEATQSIDGGFRGIGAAQPGMGGMVDGLSFWMDEPAIGRVATGVPQRVDRLKGLGNAVIPQIPEMIGHAILEAENERISHDD